MKRDVRNAFRRLKKEGVHSTAKVAWQRGALILDIWLQSRGKLIARLHGCRFDIRQMATSPMKLAILAGSYEEPERNAAQKFIDSKCPVVELGACIGVLSCVTNKLLENPAAHAVVEANPLAIPFLRANRDANNCSFTILNSAIAYETESVTFTPASDLWGNALRNDQNEPPVTVSTTSLGRILEQFAFEKFALMCDIEGHEYELVMRESEVLRGAELIIMEIHPAIIGSRKNEELLLKLKEIGFDLVSFEALVAVFRKQQATRA